jgi:hypothetical protein
MKMSDPPTEKELSRVLRKDEQKTYAECKELIVKYDKHPVLKGPTFVPGPFNAATTIVELCHRLAQARLEVEDLESELSLREQWGDQAIAVAKNLGLKWPNEDYVWCPTEAVFPDKYCMDECPRRPPGALCKTNCHTRGTESWRPR